MMQRKTKIVATLGPATDDSKVLREILHYVDVVRLNFSHGVAADHIRRASTVRALAAELGRHVAILADLQGPKIRTTKFKSGKVLLKEGDAFTLNIHLPDDQGDQQQVGVTYPALAADVKPGQTLLLDDGRIVMDIVAVADGRIDCRVVVGGVLSNNKGINLKCGGLSAPAITDKDIEDIQTIAQIQAEYVAISFPRTAEDMHYARALLAKAGSKPFLVAKIERAEAILDPTLDEILDASDVAMVARGDLGVEIGDEELPGVQKKIIRRALAKDKLVITATQMMESMIENLIPTRAEVLDVANAVLDGTDAVMLSGETAAGKHPLAVVMAMHRICVGAEQHRKTVLSLNQRLQTQFHRIDESIAIASMYIANHLPLKAVIALTESGSTPLWMSRVNAETPIYALTRHPVTAARTALFQGVYPILFDVVAESHAAVNLAAVNALKARNLVKDGDLVLITKGDLDGVHGGTNALKIVRVGEMAEPK
jgi:pyruvate kinase